MLSRWNCRLVWRSCVVLPGLLSLLMFALWNHPLIVNNPWCCCNCNSHCCCNDACWSNKQTNKWYRFLGVFYKWLIYIAWNCDFEKTKCKWFPILTQSRTPAGNQTTGLLLLLLVTKVKLLQQTNCNRFLLKLLIFMVVDTCG